MTTQSTEEIDVFAAPDQPLRNLTPKEVTRFLNERVIHVSGALSPDWIKRIEEVVDAQTQSTGLQSMKANAWHTDARMHRVIMNCPIAHIAQQVLAGMSPEEDPEPREHLKPIRFFYDQMFVKHPHAPASADAQGHLGNTPWHHDITFWPIEGEQIVSVWIALDATNLENGGLEFVPGSSAFGDRYQAIGVGDEGRRPFGSNTLKPLPAINSRTTGETQASLSAISFDMEAGDILIFDAKILHGAPPNLSPRRRRGIALRYLGSDVVLNSDKYGEQTSMAPFDCYDGARSDGDKVEGYVYPQVLPQKIPAEVKRRLNDNIEPNPAKMARWLKRNKLASQETTPK